MGRIENKFRQLSEIGRKALITFVTAGDPDLCTTKQLVLEMEAKGADIVELGIPYSDPIAEGPVIQKANERALRGGLRIRDIMKTVLELREQTEIPLVYLLYFNSIFQYGIGRFFKDCAAAGIDGVIVPDLPYEEKGELSQEAEEYGVILITMVAPTSRDRLERIAADAKGFLYCVSSLGVTGVRKDFNTDFKEFFDRINRCTSIPKALGFGIATPEQVGQLKGYCDGLIVGSAVVRQIEQSSTPSDAICRVGTFTCSLRAALDE
jgi:tryptophan synthase alpha chain